MRTLPKLLLAAAVVASAFCATAVPAIAGPAAICPLTAPKLNVSGAAAAPAGYANGQVQTLGAAKAKQIAKSWLNAGSGFCSEPPTPRVAAILRKVEALYAQNQRAAAHRLILQIIAIAKAEPRALAVSVQRRSLAHALGKPCAADQSTHLDTKKLKAIDDLLHAADEATAHGDSAAAASARGNAQQIYNQFAASADPTTVGDLVALAAGAAKLGMAAKSQDYMDKAAAKATTVLDQAKAVDPCTANKGDEDCFAKAEQIAELAGVSDSIDTAAFQQMSQAIEDRIERKPVNGCEEWAFTMTFTDGQTGWTIKWAEGHFRVNRKTGVLDGSQAAGYGKGWPGLAGNATSECTETTDAGTVDLGPVGITGGGFHYAINGSIIPGGFDLVLTSADASISVTGPSDPICQALADWSQQLLDLLVKGPNEIGFELQPGQTSATNSSTSADGTTIVETITQVNPG